MFSESTMTGKWANMITGIQAIGNMRQTPVRIKNGYWIRFIQGSGWMIMNSDIHKKTVTQINALITSAIEVLKRAETKPLSGGTQGVEDMLGVIAKVDIAQLLWEMMVMEAGEDEQKD